MVNYLGNWNNGEVSLTDIVFSDQIQSVYFYSKKTMSGEKWIF